MEVALVSCRELPEPDPDAAPLAAALAAAGIRSEIVAWDDPEADWARARLTVLRSAWNYPRRHEAFLAWAARAAGVSELWNPLPVVRWNSHKGYLLELERAGVPIAPTVLLPRGDRRSLAAILAERGWGEVVVKPAVSAASFLTLRCSEEALEAGEGHLARLLAERDALVQEYLPSVESYGERALIWIDGELTHAVRKTPRFAGEAEHVSHQAVPIAAAEAALATQALAAVEPPLLYARIDLARAHDGAPVVMELELIEPSLFFAQGPAALARFVGAIHRRLA